MRFLGSVCREILALPPEDTTVVLPSQRACVYLREEYKAFQKTMILPEITTMDRFTERLSSIGTEDRMNLALCAYKILAKDMPGMDFYRFQKIFNIILNDFNDFDMYLKNIDMLDNLREISKLEYYEKGTLAEKYFNVMGIFKSVYNELNRILDEKGSGYRGRVYRKACENINNTAVNKNIIFAGFNIFTPAEKGIINGLIKKSNIRLLFNIPQILINSSHESAYFIRQHLQEWPDNAVNIDCTCNAAISIHEYSLPTDQVKVLNSEDLKDNTAIVLSDESLMIPVINGIPEGIDRINITMGYPLKMTTAYMFLKAIMQLHINKTERGYHRDDVLNLLESKYTKEIMAGQANAVKGRLKASNAVYVDINAVFGGFENTEIMEYAFDWYENGRTIKPQAVLRKLIALMEKAGINESDNPSAETNIASMINSFNRLITLINENEDLFLESGTRQLESLIGGMMSGESVPFSGDPIQDFQVMGMLETRCLDFENVIIMSVNEGMMPKGKQQNSFIPADIRQQWSLPTYVHSDLLFSFYFYSLLLNSRNSVITFARSDDDNYSDKSRFIEQLIWELRDGGLFENRMDSAHPVKQDQFNVDNLGGFQIMEKTPEIIEIIKNKSFSASGISQYIRNPMGYYINYVLGLREGKDIDELGNKEIGSAAHHVLQNVLSEQIGKMYDSRNADYEEGYIEELVEQSFSENRIPESGSGKPYIMKKAITKMVRNFIEEDRKRSDARIKLLDLEKGYDGKILTESGNLTLYGIFDRIEDDGNVLRIMDYKTGKVDKNELKIDLSDKMDAGQLLNIADWKKKLKSDKKFQLLFYGYVACRQKGWENREFNMGIYSLRTPSEVYYLTDRNGEPIVYTQGSEIDKTFESILNDIISEILDPDIPFIYIDRPDWT